MPTVSREKTRSEEEREELSRRVGRCGEEEGPLLSSLSFSASLLDRLEVADDARVLPLPAALLLVQPVELGSLRDGLAVGDARARRRRRRRCTRASCARRRPGREKKVFFVESFRSFFCVRFFCFSVFFLSLSSLFSLIFFSNLPPSAAPPSPRSQSGPSPGPWRP